MAPRLEGLVGVIQRKDQEAGVSSVISLASPEADSYFDFFCTMREESKNLKSANVWSLTIEEMGEPNLYSDFKKMLK